MSKSVKKASITSEMGVSGVHISSGYVYEEFLPELRGPRGMRTYRQMRDNDATIGALISAIDMLLRSVEWHAEAAEGGEVEAEWLDTVFTDMDHTWEDFISNVLTMLPFGWSYFELVFKRRLIGKSKFEDGKIGIHKIAERAQETLDRWQMDPKNQNVEGMWQQPPDIGTTIFIPIQKALHFRTAAHKNNPEGRSILRNAYSSWYYLKNIQRIEAIAIERELAGLPIVRIPSEYLDANADADKAAVRAQFEKAARDLKFNEQGALVIPSDPYEDAEGNPSTMRKVEIDLISSAGTRSIDTSAVVTRYQQDIVRTVLADFLLLGAGERGSFALSKSKTDLFLKSLESYINNIAAVINRQLIPKLWALNGFDLNKMPTYVPGEVAPVDLEEFGNYIQRIAAAGVQISGDEETEGVIRGAAGLPETPTNILEPLFGPDPLVDGKKPTGAKPSQVAADVEDDETGNEELDNA